MQRTRLFAAASAAALLALGAGSPWASADTHVAGGGTTALEATALSLEIGTDGDVLAVRVLGENSSSNIDPAKGAPTSGASVTPLSVSSSRVPALNIATPSVSTTSTGQSQSTSQEVALPEVPGVSGTVTAGLSSVVDSLGARSGITAGVGGLNLAGLLTAPNAVVQAATDSATNRSGASYTITIPEVTVLDLDGVLDIVGLELTDLSLQTVLDLLSGLDLSLPEIPDAEEAVAALNSAIDTLQDETGPLTDEVCSTVDDLLAGLTGVVDDLPVDVDDTVDDLLPDIDESDVVDDIDEVLDGDAGDSGGDLPVDVPDLGLSAAALEDIDCSTITKTAEQLLDDVQETLATLVQATVVDLADVALLAVRDVEIAVQSVATGDVATSLADVTASIGEVTVGGLDLAGLTGLQLTDGVEVLQQATATVNGALDDVLGIVNAQLGQLVDVELLTIDEQVGTAGEYVTSLASLTAVKAVLTPPTDLLGIAAVPLTDSVSEVISTLGGTVPGLSTVTAELEAALGGLEVLEAPAVLTVGQVRSASAFRPGAVQPLPGQTPTPGGETPGGDLPRTGADAALPAMAGAGLAGLALAIRRLLKGATPTA